MSVWAARAYDSFIQTFVDSLEQVYSRRSTSMGSTSGQNSPATPSISKSFAGEIPQNAQTAAPLEPTTRLSSRTATSKDDGYSRTTLRLIDTHGLAMGHDLIQEKERERGVAGLLRMMEGRFTEVMREESRVIRKSTRGEDDLVHLGKPTEWKGHS